MAKLHDELDVFLNETRIGKLSATNGVMSFRYSPEFLNDPSAYPLSQSLPLKDMEFTDPVVENFCLFTRICGRNPVPGVRQAGDISTLLQF